MGPFSGWTFWLWMWSSHLVHVWLHAWKDALAVIVSYPFVLSCGCPSFSSLVCLCFSMVLNRPWGGSHGLAMDMVSQRHRMDPERLSSISPLEKKLPRGTHPWMPFSSDAKNRNHPTGSVGVSACHAKGSQGATAIPGVSAIEGATVHSGVSARVCVCVDPCHPWSAGVVVVVCRTIGEGSHTTVARKAYDRMDRIQWDGMWRWTWCSFVLCGWMVDGAAKTYHIGDDVPIYANKVGPFHNPSETYQYYDLPFCKPIDGVVNKWEDLGEVLEGDRMTTTPYDLKFREDHDFTEICTKTLEPEEAERFREAVLEDYYFQMFYDDLPLWGFLGKVVPEQKGETPTYKKYLFSHLHFELAYNQKNVIEINVSTDPLKTVDISQGSGQLVTFSYSAKWTETDVPHERRMEKYTKYSFLRKHLDIHWFSIINSCVIVLLLTGLLSTILHRTLKRDFLRYTSVDPEVPDEDESGWKLIHADVFRAPQHRSLFAALIGTGSQVFVMSLCIFALALVGTFYPYNRGALLTACVVFYSLTAGVAGYVSASLYKKMGGTNWANNVLLTVCVFCGPLLVAFSYLNTVAIFYRSTAALPFGTIVIILVIWALITFPLTVVGGIAGKNRATELDAPCRTSKYARKIPQLPWYRGVIPQMTMAGFLPFSAIYIELYYIFASIWGHKVYTIYSIIFIVFALLLVVTSFVTIALTYFQLAVEDWRWWWRSVLCGGSTGVFIFGYCFYFFNVKSDMTGLIQTSFFFGYMFLVSYAFFLMLGAIGFFSSLLFVKRMYRAIKCE